MAEYYEFNAVKFGPRISDMVPQVSPTLKYGERSVPYSNTTILDIGGRGASTYQAEIRVAPTDVAAFEAQLGEEGLLILAGVEYPGATLIRLQNHIVTPFGEWHFYEAEWRVQ